MFNFQNWLTISIMETIKTSEHTLHTLVAGNPAAFMKVLQVGFSQLVLNARTSSRPETYRMDWERISSLHDELYFATSATAMLSGLVATLKTPLLAVSTSSVKECVSEMEAMVMTVGENIKDCCPCHLLEVCGYYTYQPIFNLFFNLFLIYF